MEIVKYLCEFFFTNFWHYIGLLLIIALLFNRNVKNKVINELRKNFDAAVLAYLKELHKKFDWAECYGYWIGGDCTGVYCYGDYTYMDLSDIIYIVDNNVNIDEFEEWQGYCEFAEEFNQTVPNLPSWHKG